MHRINIAAPEFDYDAKDPEGFRAGTACLRKTFGAERCGASVYEIPPGQAPRAPTRSATRPSRPSAS
jgi:hypothetical protein